MPGSFSGAEAGRIPLRVVIVAPAHMVGGQAHAARSLVDGLDGDAAVRATFQPSDPRLGGPLGFLTRWPVLRTLIRPVLLGLQLWRVARDADVIHAFAAAHTAFLFGALPAICVARLRRRPLILNYHDGRAEAHLKRWGAPLRWVLKRCDAIVVPSQFLQAVFARAGLTVHVVPNVVDTREFGYRPAFPPPPRLLSVRSLESLYAVENTIAAFALLSPAFPELRLEIYGGGPEAGRLRSAAAGLDRVRFHGVFDHAAMPGVLAEGGIVVNSSRIDNQPLFILEAFASGVPVVSTAAGGIPDLIREGENGLLVPLDDPGALAEAVRRLLEDPPLVRRLVGQAHADVGRYQWPAVREQWVAEYRLVAG